MKTLTKQYLLDAMGSEATDAEATAMLGVLKIYGITTEEQVEDLSTWRWARLVEDALILVKGDELDGIFDSTRVRYPDIRERAMKEGLDTVTRIGSNHKTGDALVEVFQFGDARVAGTNADSIWEESDPAEFAALLQAEGIVLKQP